MVDFKTLIDLQITIFCLLLAGYILTKAGVLSLDSRKPLSALLINFVLPCNIFFSFMIDFNMQILKDCLAILIVSVCAQILAVVVSRFIYPGSTREQLAVLRYGTVVSNAGFMGNPVAYGLFGTQGLLYASFYQIPLRIFMWSAGLACFTGTKGDHVIRKVLTHPCIIAIFLGMIRMVFQVPLPSGLEKAITYSSNCTTALSMLTIGNILAGVNLKSAFSPKIIWYCLVRLLLIPTVVYGGCLLFHAEPLVRSLCVVLTGMPAAATTAILAANYDCDDEFAAKLVFLSTILSLFTVPILCLLFNA